MKKFIISVLVLACFFALTGCSEQASAYSLYAEHEYFVISDVEIVLNNNEEVFDGGNIEIIRPDIFSEVVSYTTTFYVLTDTDKKVILSNCVIDQTGETVAVDADLGSISGEAVCTEAAESIDDLKTNLWFELKTTDINGNENIYKIRLESIQ